MRESDSYVEQLLESLKQTVASLEYWFPRNGDPEGVNSQMMKNARQAIMEALAAGYGGKNAWKS